MALPAQASARDRGGGGHLGSERAGWPCWHGVMAASARWHGRLAGVFRAPQPRSLRREPHPLREARRLLGARRADRCPQPALARARRPASSGVARDRGRDAATRGPIKAPSPDPAVRARLRALPPCADPHRLTPPPARAPRARAGRCRRVAPPRRQRGRAPAQGAPAAHPLGPWLADPCPVAGRACERSRASRRRGRARPHPSSAHGP